MAIKLDRSTTTVVIWCTEHTFWRAMRFDMDEGHKSAENHELLYHPGDDTAHRAARAWRQRNRFTETVQEYLDVLPDLFDGDTVELAPIIDGR